MANNTGSAHWQGTIKDGGGKISTASGALKDLPYGFKSRFEDGPGTNPEELIGAAHAGCFSMALSVMLTEAGATDIDIQTTSKITLKKETQGFSITDAALTSTVHAGGLDKAEVERLAGEAEKNCPVSKVLKANITLDLTVA